MPKLISRHQARLDLDEIWLFVAQNSLESADRLIDEIKEMCRRLAENPRMGRSRDALTPDLRSFPVGNYLIFYQPLSDGIEVIRVLSGSRDLPSAFS